MIRPRTLLFFCSNSSSISHISHRWISSTTQLHGSWINNIKGVFTGQKTSPDTAKVPISESFTLLRFADELGRAKKLGTLKQYVVGRGSEVTFAEAFEKQQAILQYLGALDPTGENLQTIQKQQAAKHCKCTIVDVENMLAKFTWAKEAQMKLEKMKEEGKPLPKSMAEVQKLMGSSPLDVARSNMAKSGQISRNAFCPCGSKKRYKRCCGKDSTF
ncbi:uncharacterized protein [Solanum tuberosum]|uniref:Uncharacterized protein n=1 Tax=Solanum tuberosum TaxID=4113 RepID=M1C1B4_SOLTU|nr:PREDICTED: uncharacterized protein LOC102594209 [Solanum tuberosum]